MSYQVSYLTAKLTGNFGMNTRVNNLFISDCKAKLFNCNARLRIKPVQKTLYPR